MHLARFPRRRYTAGWTPIEKLERLSRLLGGLSREEFCQRFGIDHQELIQGGQEIVRGGGDLGSALLSRLSPRFCSLWWLFRTSSSQAWRISRIDSPTGSFNARGARDARMLDPSIAYGSR